MNRICAYLLPIFFSFAFNASASENCSSVPDELDRMATADQSLRYNGRNIGLKGPEERADWNLKVLTLNRVNGDKLKSILDRCGWPSEETLDGRSSVAARLIAQHSDHDDQLQMRALAVIEGRVKSGQVDPKQFAHLMDRIQLRRTGKQIYGTQLLVSNEDITLPSTEIDDIDSVNKRRKALGMESVEAYIAQAKESQFGKVAR